MTAARPIHRDAIVHVYRRCVERRFLLRPDRRVVALFEYLLAVGTAKFGLGLIQATGMSTHYHLELYDPEGRVPEFTQWFNALYAKGVNEIRGRKGSVFESSEQCGLVYLVDAGAVERTAAYIACNPVEAGAVARGKDWPGFRSPPNACLRPRTIVRPTSSVFRNEETFPKEVQLRFIVPPTHAHLNSQQWADCLTALVRRREADLHANAGAHGLRFGTPRLVLKRPWKDRASAREEAPSKRITHSASSIEARRYLKSSDLVFRRMYRTALDAYRSGRRTVEFPPGTWKMTRVYGARALPSTAGSWQGENASTTCARAA